MLSSPSSPLMGRGMDFPAATWDFKQSRVGLSQQMTQARVLAQELGSFHLELAILLNQYLDLGFSNFQSRLKLLVLLLTNRESGGGPLVCHIKPMFPVRRSEDQVPLFLD